MYLGAIRSALSIDRQRWSRRNLRNLKILHHAAGLAPARPHVCALRTLEAIFSTREKPMTKYPWLKFYPSDWRGDPLLRRCSLSARGLWIELIAVMHEGAEYGHLDPLLSDQDIARIVGSSLKNVRSALAELERSRVFDRGEKGEIVSRRMVRDHAKAMRDRENGRRGGNPGLKPGVNPEVKAQIPEARIQIPETRIQNHHHSDDGDADRTMKKLSIGSPPSISNTASNLTNSSSISDTALKLTSTISAICGHSGGSIPPRWAGAPRRVQVWLDHGWTAEQIEASCRQQMARKPGGAPASIFYFEQGIADFVADGALPVSTASPRRAVTYGRPLSPRAQKIAEMQALVDKRRREREAWEPDERAAGDLDGPCHPADRQRQQAVRDLVAGVTQAPGGARSGG
jgi:hypothetical protein